MQLGGREDGLHEPDAQRLGGVDQAAAQAQIARPAVADLARQTLRAAPARRDAEADLGLAETGVVGGEADVAAERELAAAAQGEAVDGRDPGLRRALDGLDHLAAEPRRLARLLRG